MFIIEKLVHTLMEQKKKAASPPLSLGLHIYLEWKKSSSELPAAHAIQCLKKKVKQLCFN